MLDKRAQFDPQNWNQAYAEGFAAGIEEAKRRIAIWADMHPRDRSFRLGLWAAWHAIVSKPTHKAK